MDGNCGGGCAVQQLSFAWLVFGNAANVYYALFLVPPPRVLPILWCQRPKPGAWLFLQPKCKVRLTHPGHDELANTDDCCLDTAPTL